MPRSHRPSSMKIVNRRFLPILLAALAAVSCNALQAQLSVGVSAGFTLSQPDKEPGMAYSRCLPAGGFAIGIPIQYDPGKHLALRAEPGIYQMNTSMERTGDYAGTWEKRYNNYIQLPLMLQYRTGGRKFSGFAQAGLSAGYWISSRQEGAVPDIYDLVDQPNSNGGSTSYFRYKKYNEKYAFDSRKDQRFSIAAVAGLGLNYHYNQQFRFYLELRYSQGLNSYEKAYMANGQRPLLQTSAAMLGCMMNLFNRN